MRQQTWTTERLEGQSADVTERADFLPCPVGPPHAMQCEDPGDTSGQFTFSQANHKHDHILILSDVSMRPKQKLSNEHAMSDGYYDWQAAVEQTMGCKVI